MSDSRPFLLVCFPDSSERHALDPELGLAHAGETLCELLELDRQSWRFAGRTTCLTDIDCPECRERAEIIVAKAALGGEQG